MGSFLPSEFVELPLGGWFHFRVAGQEEGAEESGPEEEVQKEFRLLGVREEGALHHPEDGEEAVVLLVRHHPRLLQHGLRRRRALQPTALADRLFA